MEQSNTVKPKTNTIKWIVVGLIIGIIGSFIIVYELRTKSPQVKILSIDAERYDISEYSDACRAKIMATIQNYGDVDTYVTVKLTIEWTETHSDVATVFVKAHTTVKAVGDVQATLQWFNYEAEIIEVRK